MSEPYIGQIQIFAFNFPPRGWAVCDGQTLPISQNSALFSLLGTTYGGDGRTTFALPDLRGRSPVHMGTGTGLSPIRIGQKGGAETHQLTVAELAAHTHGYRIDCNSDMGDADNPENRFPAPSNENVYSTSKDALMSPMTTAQTGSGQAFNIRSPYLALNFCIALTGVFPSRS